MTTSTRILLAVLATGCITTTAYAQANNDQPATVRSGPLEFSPSILTSNSQDSNITRVGGITPIASYEFFTIPQVDATYKQDRFSLIGAAAAEFVYTPGEVTASKKTNFNNYAEVSLDWSKTVIRPTFLLWRRNTYARPDFEVGAKSQRLARTIDAGLEWNPGRMRFAGGFVDDRTRYDADAIFQGVKLAEKLNFDVYTTRMTVGVKLRPSFEVGGGYEATKERFIVAPDRNGDGYRAYGTVIFQTPLRMFGSVNFGIRGFTPSASPSDKFTGTFVRAAAGLHHGGTNVLATVNRDIGFSYDSGRGFFVATTVLGTIRRTLSRRVEVEFETSTQHGVYHPVIETAVQVKDMQRVDALGSLWFAFKPYLRVGANVEREVTKGAEFWNAWRFSFFTTYGNARFRKIDRPLPR